MGAVDAVVNDLDLDTFAKIARVVWPFNTRHLVGRNTPAEGWVIALVGTSVFTN